MSGIRSGRLYRIDPDRSVHVMLENTGTANGMGFTSDLRTMYFCDSGKACIYSFEYNRQTGEMTNGQKVVCPPPDQGKPDGMTVDAQDRIWSARWDGWQLVRHGSDGTVLATIKFPAAKVSCITFGGKELEDMYVTTAGGYDRQENGGYAGSLFKGRVPGVKGKPEFRSKF